MYNYTPVTVYPVKESDDWMNLTGEEIEILRTEMKEN